MPSNTEKLNLYKVNPATDGDLTFNIDLMLNDNWDKLDTAVGTLTEADTTLAGTVQELRAGHDALKTRCDVFAEKVAGTKSVAVIPEGSDVPAPQRKENVIYLKIIGTTTD